MILCTVDFCLLENLLSNYDHIYIYRYIFLLEHLALASCSISQNIREGLLEVFYGVYEKDPNKVIASLRFLFFCNDQV